MIVNRVVVGGRGVAVSGFASTPSKSGPRAQVCSSARAAQRNAVPLAALIQAASAFGNWNAITPPFQPAAAAWSTHVPSVAGSMKPLLASDTPPGLPITSLFSSNPFAGISRSAEPVNGAPAVVIRPAQSR